MSFYMLRHLNSLVQYVFDYFYCTLHAFLPPPFEFRIPLTTHSQCTSDYGICDYITTISTYAREDDLSFDVYTSHFFNC